MILKFKNLDKFMNKNLKVLGIGVLLIGLAVAGWFLYTVSQSQNGVELTQNNTENQKQELRQVAKNDAEENKGEVEELQIEDIDTSNWKTYRNEEMGVKFKYPKSWGELKEYVSIGCYDYEKQEIDTTMFTKKDKCNQIALYGSKKAGLFFATETPLMSKTGTPRDSYFGDQSGRITGIEYVKNLCQNKSKDDCITYKTKNGVLVAKNKEQEPFSEKFVYVYYINSPHPIYSGIVFSSERLPYSDKVNVEVIEGVIDTLEFVTR